MNGSPSTQPAMERLFLAIWPSPAATQHAKRTIDLVAQHPEATSVSWKPTGRWHMTVLFLGTLPVRHHRRIRQVAAKAATNATPSSLALAGSGIFNNALWLGTSGSSWLSDLHNDVTILTGGRQSFVAHLTIARGRHDPIALRWARDQLTDYVGVPWQPRTLDLVRSQLGASPSYEIVAQFPLGS